MTNDDPASLNRALWTPEDSSPIDRPFQLHPLDQEVLELGGTLPDIPLLAMPAVADQLRRSSPSVHRIETTDRNPTRPLERADADSLGNHNVVDDERLDYTYRGYLLRPRMAAYTRAREIYAAVDGSIGGKFSTRLQNCRRKAWFVKHKFTNQLRVMSSRCKLRWCPICRDVSRMIVTKSVDEWLHVQKYPKMITLTLEHSNDTLSKQIQRLYDCFRKLRRRAYFHRLITGGIWFFQVKYNRSTQQWHPHVHCLVAGQFLPHSRLRSLWHEITGDSFIVDIRAVHDVESASTEVARYATSPADLTKVDLQLALEIFDATKGRRICGSWGSAKGLALKPTVQDDRDSWDKVADFYFINVSKDYDDAAKTFWQCFKKGEPYEGPPLQPDSDLYQEEVALLLELDKPPPTWNAFGYRILERKANFLTGFFDQEE